MGVYSQSDGYILCKDELVWSRIKDKLSTHQQEQKKKGRPVIFENPNGFIYNPDTKKVYFSIDDIKARTMPDVLNFWEELVIYSKCEELFLIHRVESEFPLTPFGKYQAQWVRDNDFENTTSYFFESNIKLSFFWKSRFVDESDYLKEVIPPNKFPQINDYPWLKDEFEQWGFYCSLYGIPEK